MSDSVSSSTSSARPTRSLKGRTAIVTGAGAAGEGIGNGRAAAVLLAEAGCRVVCVDLKFELAQRTVEMIGEDEEEREGRVRRESGGEGEGEGEKEKEKASSHATNSSALPLAIAVEADVTKAEDCARIVRTAVDAWGRLDILVNVVGVGGAVGTAVEVDMVEWARGMEINVGSMVMMSKFAIPEMRKNTTGQWRGSITNISSVAGLRGGNSHLLYPTSKGAIVNMTRAMASHHAADGIRVNCVCPGMVYTPMMYASGMSAEARESRKNRSLLKTEGTGWDVGAAIRFLAGDEARWLTGVILPVDAGSTVATSSDVPSVNPGPSEGAA